MLPLLKDLDAKLVGAPVAGMFPDKVSSFVHVWTDAQDVLFSKDDVRSAGQRSLVLSAGAARGLGALRRQTGVQELFYGTLTTLMRSVAFGLPTSVGTGFSTQQHESAVGLAGHWQFAPWGEWMLASNGASRIQVSKAGAAFTSLQQGGTSDLAITSARLLNRFGAYILAANTNVGTTSVHWCSDDNPEDWVPSEINTAGDYVIRDADSELTCACELGDKLAYYTRASMTVVTYIGAPFVFSFSKALKGVGAWGGKSVAAAGRRNYGWGPQGMWETDGVSFTYLDDEVLRVWLSSRLYRGQASKIVAYHNEDRHCIEWSYPIDATGENAETIVFDYQTRSWHRGSVPFSAALDREVFGYALTANGTNIYAEGSGDYGSPLLLSKPLSFGDPGQEFFISDVRVIHSGTLTVTVGLMDDIDSAVVWLTPVALAANWDNVEVFRTARFFKIKIEGAAAWRVTGILFYGKAMGYRL